MGVKIRERNMAGDEVAFYIDTYHKDFGRFSQKTGLKANPKNRKEYNQIKAEALERARKIERDLMRDPKAVFDRKAVAGDDFVDYVRERAEKNHHPSYMNALKYLREFTGGNISFENVNSQWLERFKSYLLSIRSLSSNTANIYLIFMKGCIRLAYRVGYIPEDFTGKVAGIGKQPIERHVLTLDELETLSQTKCKNVMVKLAFLFSCFTGLRLSDIELLKWEKIIIENGQYFMKFQQKKTREFEKMPLCAQAVELLQAVQKLHAEYAPEGDERVFILPDRSWLGTILNEWGFRSGLSWRLHFHASRHTFASLALSAGTAFFTVSKLLGHRDLKTTEIYSHLNPKDQIKAVQGMPMLSPVIEPQPIASTPEQILQLQPAHAQQPVSTITQTLTTKGETIANALGLKKNQQGNYEFEGKQYTPIDLALEVAGNNK